MATYQTENEYEKGIDHKGNVHDIHASEYDVQTGEPRELKRVLQGRHMQMIAIGGAIGAGYFVGSGGALQTGGPGSLVVCFIIIGIMMLFVMQALAELAVLYPVNGAFYQWTLRFVDPSWAFATGWDYAIQWLTILPFEVTAATIIVGYWEKGAEINPGVWITVFLVPLIIIQIFGIRGYGEVEFVLSMIKVIATVGFIILAIIIDCGGVPTQTTGYIGAKYWYAPGAFLNGFSGFCSVFVTASFAFGGTELTGLAAAEAANPLKAIPQAARQVFWRIAIFYVVGLFLVGLIVSADNDGLTASGSRASPFVIAIRDAGIQGLDSVFNVVICLSVISVANSCTFGSTRTMQAMAQYGQAPKFLAYVDKSGRPVWCVLIQVLFGFLAYVACAQNDITYGPAAGATTSNVFFTWLLALSGLANFFIWGTICLSHMRFRAGWKAAGRTLDEIPYKAAFGVWGSAVGLFLNIICIMAAFYAAIAPGGEVTTAYYFFEQYLAAPLLLVLYLAWKLWSRDTKLFIRAHEMDITTGLREDLDTLHHETVVIEEHKTWANLPYRAFRAVF